MNELNEEQVEKDIIFMANQLKEAQSHIVVAFRKLEEIYNALGVSG